MCEYCQGKKELLTYENYGSIFEGYTEIDLALIIDRGYLRLVDIDDKNCLDHGEKIKINYCPNCGREITE